MTSSSRRAIRTGFTTLALTSVLVAGAGTADADSLSASNSATSGSSTPQGDSGSSNAQGVPTGSAAVYNDIFAALTPLFFAACGVAETIVGQEFCYGLSGRPA
ncbi:hypothetical protein [Nocardia sp. NBC_01327]|uniref:hypothetical protein n=1 Tax=Nocardia sp. NBC_01327 TaxID=2903593 RepID=UPI002E16766F|nr:hypothetical protein OG326_34920 [Nocardia sp. NBC_01327]